MVTSRVPAGGNSYRAQQRSLTEFFDLAKAAVEAQKGLNFTYSPQDYKGELPFAFIDYPEQQIKITVHSLRNRRLAQDAGVSLNIHVFVSYDKQGDAVRYLEHIADYLYSEHPFDMGIVPIIEPDGTNHFILQVHG
jgi:hypothetical protein